MEILILIILALATFCAALQSRSDYLGGRRLKADIYAAAALVCSMLFGAGMVMVGG